MNEYTHGLRATVLIGPYGDCSNGGYSSRYKHVIIVGPDIPPLHPVRHDQPAVRLSSTAPGYTVAEPLYRHADLIGPMASGAYVVVQYESDGAAVWRSLLGTTFSAAIPFHDRFETQDQYDALSR